ncbi:MAG TPA: ABC transporter substrate-binding protein [Chloroflexota bacterium]|nr:ABC transporter substrate-binding protein [Chloroflexota bacterium]
MNAFLGHLRPPRIGLGRQVRARVVAAASLALAALAVMVAAPASTLTPAANAQAPLTIRMSYQPVLIAAPLMVAMEKGYFEQANLNVELNVVWQSAELMAAFASGNMDAAAGGIGPAQMNAISRGILNPRLISPLHTERPPVATPLTVRKALWDSGEVRSVADLKGRKVALNSKASATEYWLYAALATGGLTPSDVDVVELPFPDAVAAMANGVLDASLIGEPNAVLGEQNGALVRLSEDFIDDFQVTAVYFDSTFAEKNRPAVEAFLAAYLRGARDLEGDGYRSPENLMILEKHTKIPAATIAASRVPYHDPEGRVHVEDFQKLNDFFVAQGVAPALDMASLVDLSYAEAARRLLAEGTRGR